MNEEMRRVLNLLSEGKINAAEAEQLIKALEDKRDPDNPGTDRAKKREPRFLRITVEDCSKGGEGGDRANIRIPLSFLKAGMKLGACIPGGKGEGLRTKLREQGIDLDTSALSKTSSPAWATSRLTWKERRRGRSGLSAQFVSRFFCLTNARGQAPVPLTVAPSRTLSALEKEG